MTHYFWDEHKVRYQLATTCDGGMMNWLFFPGGPGGDSSYLLDLVNDLQLPGNTWLIDLPNNGTNIISDDYNFDNWFDVFLPTISRFKNPVYVGHSFGGMMPLMFPQLEEILKGLVILNSAPSLWQEEANRVASEKGKPLVVEPLQKFMENPCNETFKAAFMACAPYYFPDSSLEKGKVILDAMPFYYPAAVWGLNKFAEIQYNASFIPQRLPTLIIGGTEDCMTPSSLFLNDARFQRDNIRFEIIEGAGHIPWFENFSVVKQAFYDFSEYIAGN